MADGITLNSGTGGATLAADDVTGTHYQILKVAFGALDTATLVTSSVGLPVGDAGGSLTVDAPAGTPVFVRLSDGAAAVDTIPVSLASVPSHAVTNAGTFAVQATVAAGATNIAKAEDVASADADVGVPALAVRKATPANTSGADGDYEFLQISAGRLWASATIDAALPAGTNAIGKLAANSGVDIGDVDVTSVIPGTGATNLGKAIDSVLGGTDTGVLALTVRDDALATLTEADGDVSALRVDSTGRLWANVSNTVTVASHAVTNAGTFAVQVDGNALTALQLIDNPVLVDDAAFTPATSSVMMAGFEADEGSTDSVDEGDAGAARMTLDRKVIVNPQPHTAGGLSIFRSLDLDETEEDVKTSAGQVYGWAVSNMATSTRFLKFYNLTAANTTVGSSTPVITWAIPGNSSDDVSANVMGAMGIAFDTAICVAATTGIADADTGAPAANDVLVNIFYK